MSSYDMPSARQARMNDAERRVPRIVGFPLRRSGFVTRYRNPGIGVSSMSSPSGGPHFHYGAPSRPKYTCLLGLGLTFFVSPSTHFTTGLYHSTRSTAAPPCSAPPHDRRVHGHPRHHGHPARWPLQRLPEGVSSPWSDLALNAPRVYYDPDAKVAIAPVWTDGGSAGVSVTVEGSARFPSSTSIE